MAIKREQYNDSNILSRVYSDNNLKLMLDNRIYDEIICPNSQVKDIVELVENEIT